MQGRWDGGDEIGGVESSQIQETQVENDTDLSPKTVIALTDEIE